MFDGDRPPIVAVVGPTAAGKSGLSLDLAEALGGEVVNTDAMQLYRGMDVGTAKLPQEQRRGVVHHLLDVLEVTQTATVAQFQRLARAAVADCRSRGRVPVLVGGSALYTRAVLDRFDFPGTDPSLRAALERRLAEEGPGRLHAALAAVDPEAAARILPGNGRRVVRALEVVALTGKPFSAALPGREYVDPDTVQLGLQVPRPELDDRIAARVDRMWGDGLVEEVRRLEPQLRRARTAAAALGYRQVLRHLSGEIDQDQARRLTVQATRRFARRQESWLRKDDRVVWLRHDEPELANQAVAAVLRRGPRRTAVQSGAPPGPVLPP